MSFLTDARDDLENVGAVATAPFTFGQSERMVSNSGQNSGLGNLSQHYSELWRDADIGGLVAGGAYLGAAALSPTADSIGTSVGGQLGAAAGTEAPASTTATLSQGILNGGEGAAVPTSATQALAGTAGATPVPSAADTAVYGLTPGQSVDAATGSVVTPGTGSGAAATPGFADWVQAHPIASIIGANMLGGAASGVASRQTQLEAIEKKKEAELELADLPRKTKQGNPSVGGKGVNLNVKPSGKILKRPDGTPVFVPGTGIISNGMNGTRG